MSRLKALKTTENLEGLAEVLGYSPKGIAYIIYKIPLAARYKEFTIPKKDGSARVIKAPEPKLMALQRRLADVLYEIVEEIGETETKYLKAVSHGFLKDRSIITNACKHEQRRFVLNLDLKDFFPSMHFGRVRGFFMKDKHFLLHEKVATIIAQIACDGTSLPQGSPCSPIISNLIAHILDMRIVKLAQLNGCTYTRYVDDITISTNQKSFPTAIACQDSLDMTKWSLGDELRRQIEKSRFEVNGKKTRMQVRGGRQIVTGLTVNSKVNIPQEYYKTTRAMCHSVFTYGKYYEKIVKFPVSGKPEYSLISTTNFQALEGRMRYIYFVKNSMDRRDSKTKKSEHSAARKLLHRLLFFKYFVNLEKPLIITEGKTDAVYIKCALRQLYGEYPDLASTDGKNLKLLFQFLKFTSSVHDVLQLGGGTGDLKHLVKNYDSICEEYKYAPQRHPVILILDNDDGASPVFSTAKKYLSQEIRHDSTKPFYHLKYNLYIVKTPEKLGAGFKSCIEDCFAPSLLQTELGGKKFNPNSEIESETSYGKNHFAEFVVKPNQSTIDFGGFKPVLDRIVAAINNYKRV